MVSYTIKNGSVVPPLTEKTDTYTAVSLEYTFQESVGHRINLLRQREIGPYF
jgi:hypothetical protein